MDPMVIGMVAKLIRDMGLVHFAPLTGRTRKRVYADDPEDPSALPIAEIDDDEPDAPTHVPSAQPSTPTMVAVPELTHPGESASNGLAERSVRAIEEFSRTLITALQVHIRVPLTMAHPLCHWAIQHAAYQLNKYRLDKDGHTAYGRLHGKETREHLCELGEKVLYHVSKNGRAKMDAIWGYGIFSESKPSAQSYQGKADGS